MVCGFSVDSINHWRLGGGDTVNTDAPHEGEVKNNNKFHLAITNAGGREADWLKDELNGYRNIVYGKPAGISEPRYYKIRWMSVFLDMRNMLNCINLYRFGVWPLIHCLKICKKLLYDNYILKIILLDTNFPLKIWRIKLEISLLINPN